MKAFRASLNLLKDVSSRGAMTDPRKARAAGRRSQLPFIWAVQTNQFLSFWQLEGKNIQSYRLV